MKIIPFLAIAAIIVTAISCDKEQNSRTVSGSTATLDYKECVYFEEKDITVCFTDANEYRCPCFADCIWAGACDVTFRVFPGTVTGKENEGAVDVTLSFSPDGSGVFPAQDTVLNKLLTIKGIVPATCDDYGNYEKYKVDVSLE